MKRTGTLCILLAVTLAPASAAPPLTDEQVRFFETRVRPLLVQHCQECHGAKKQSGGLRLDSPSAVGLGGDSGPVAVAGKPEQSLLVRAIRHQGPKMPPRKQLSTADVATLEDWVRQGARWPAEQSAVRPTREITAEQRDFWSFRPLGDPQPPEVKNPAWCSGPIDRFILARLEQADLAPVASADRRTLVRRVTFDLTGLPPDPADVEAFARDQRPDAWERVVGRLLASPAYGERWGRHWLDVVRYADTAGDNSDYPVPQLYRYRNWVLDAFNDDRPYNVFIQEQLAGDLLPAHSEQQRGDRLIATGYLAGARRFGSYEDARYQWYLTFEDTIENLGRAFLGLSLGCARCHDHKFDPISSEDYYALYGFFQSTRYPWPGIELDKAPRDLVPLLGDGQLDEAMRQRQKQLGALDERIRATKGNEQQKLKKERELLARQPLTDDLAYAVVEGKRWVGNARLQAKGDPARLGKEVPRRFPAVLGGQGLPASVKGSGRLHLAEWLSEARNPLTARVLVNRLWLHHFGRGIVPTPNDFGRQGQPPSHPELLDYLARRFIASGWSIKSMHRLILLSHTYQLASGEEGDRPRADADNRLWWRQNRRRLDAESIRDSLLSLANVLDRSVGAAHPFPPAATWNFTQHRPFKDVYETDRRSVYLMTQRIQRHPYLALFDGADTNASTAKRDASTTSLQALYLMNDPLMQRLARGFAQRLLREATDDASRIERSFQLALTRPPGAEDRAAAEVFLTQVRQRLGASDETLVWQSYARGLFSSNELIYVD